MTDASFFIPLKNRALIRVEGKDAHDFLQNLITNDMDNLQAGRILYACLLSPQGKFLFDFFVHHTDGGFALDCEGGERAEELDKRFSMYRLRADVQITMEDNVPVYAVFGDDNIGAPDPRHSEMGNRSFTKPDLPECPFEEWDRRRIMLEIPDGSRDLLVNKSTMDEAHMDMLNAISYDKGCYIGQELTARMHYRGLGKKHLKMIKLKELPDKAELRSTCGEIGLALVRSEG